MLFSKRFRAKTAFFAHSVQLVTASAGAAVGAAAVAAVADARRSHRRRRSRPRRCCRCFCCCCFCCDSHFDCLVCFRPRDVAVSQNQWFGVGAHPTFEPILVGIGMFTGGYGNWNLTHGHVFVSGMSMARTSFRPPRG